jgi:hypothetical protein
MVGRVLSASGELAGIGKGDFLVTLTANVWWEVTCTPGGIRTGIAGISSIPTEALSNGNASFSVSTVGPDPPPFYDALWCGPGETVLVGP